MDLSCPSLLMDKLTIHEQTSEYGSRETSDSEPSIGGLCQLVLRQGIDWIFQSNLDNYKLLTDLLVLQRRSYSSGGTNC